MKKKFRSLRKISALVLALMLILSAVSAGFVSAETSTPTYEVFGESIAYDLTSGLAVADTTLENGAAIITNSTATQKKITLGTDIQDFKISFKFQNGDITDSSGNIEPVLVKMRGKYVFTNPKYNVAAGDIYFAGGGETERRIQGGGSTGWHNVEITMKGSKVVIIYDGIRWYETDLIQGATSGELSVSLKYANTQIADLKVEEPTDYDAARVVNADFSTAKNTKFPVPGTFSAEESALAVTATQQSYTLGSSDEYNTVYNYTLESTFKLDGVTENAYQRGVIFNLPTGNAVAFFTDKIRTATSNDYLYNKDYFTEIAANIQDGNYHTVKIESVNDTESVFVDGECVYTFTDVVRATGKAKYQNAIQDGTVYLKNIILTEYVAPVVEGTPTMSIFGEEVAYDLSNGLVYDETASEENGYGVISNSTNNERFITLSKSVQDFKLSFKFCNGTVTELDGDNVGAPVTAIMRKVDNKAYTFGTKYWNAVSDTNGTDICFNYYDFDKYGLEGIEATTEGHRDQYGSSTGWHRVEIMILDGRAVILFDGVRWHDAEMAVAPAAGELALRIRFADTKIADVKVEEVTEEDINRVADFDCSNSMNIGINSSFLYDSTENAYSLTGTWNSGIFNLNTKTDTKTGSGTPFWAQDVTGFENYEFDMTFKSNVAATDRNDRGTLIRLPSGRWIAFYNTVIRITKTTDKETVNDGAHVQGNFDEFSSVNPQDGNYHTLNVIYKGGYESITVDGKALKSYAVDDSDFIDFKWENFRGTSGFYIKSFTVADITNLGVNAIYANSVIEQTTDSEGNIVDETTPFFNMSSNSTWTYEEIDGESAYVLKDADATSANCRSYMRKKGTVIDENGWIFKTRFYVKASDSLTSTESLFFLRLKTISESNNDCAMITMYMNQYRLAGLSNTPITDSNGDGYIQQQLSTNAWNDLEVAIIGKYVYVTLNGKTDIFMVNNGLSADSATGDHFEIKNTNLEGLLAFGATSYEYATQMGITANAIDAIGTVSETSGTAIIAAEDAYNMLGSADRKYIYYADKIANAYETYDALFADGDVTENGDVDIIDLIRIKKIAAGTADRTVKANVDKDTDKNIDAGDTVQLKKILLGVVA